MRYFSDIIGAGAVRDFGDFAVLVRSEFLGYHNWSFNFQLTISPILPSGRNLPAKSLWVTIKVYDHG